MKKKIAIFSAYYLPHSGGVERYTYNLAKKLYEYGYEIIIVTCNYNGQLKDKEKSEYATIYRLPNYKIFSSRYPICKFGNKKLKNQLKEIENEKIDFAIIQTRFWVMSYIASKFVKKNNIPSILIEHGSAHFTVNNKILDFLGEKYEHFITNRIKKSVTEYYGVSNKCVEWLKHFKITAKGVLYNSVDTEIKEKYKKDIIKGKDKIIISFVGRMIEEKGIFKLIEAFKMLQQKNSNIELYIAGDGPILKQIIEENNSNKKIHILGNLQHEEVLKLLAKTSIFVNPSSFSEGLPTTILEAGLLECAVIATPMGGTVEIIKNENLGLICSFDAENIKMNIEKLINDESEINRLANNITEKISQEFSWDTTSKKVVNIIEKNNKYA